ncbi:MAG TPA: helix-turn-helix domain-containing protein [Candidatus Acidoferrales bacterium]|nr:helix-turn-helix domain-containing protein [Candidatus Acidoferrales bacterium]
MSHWTSGNDRAFINRITFDFIAQLEKKREISAVTQSELAEKLEVTEGAVSQVFNLNRTNLNLKTMVRYARALGMKLAVVAYEDGDPKNERGPVGSELFASCWERIGRPRDVWTLDANLQTATTDRAAREICVSFMYHDMRPTGFANSTANQDTKRAFSETQLAEPIEFTSPSQEGGTKNYARI